jgi:hypothetical protein
MFSQISADRINKAATYFILGDRILRKLKLEDLRMQQFGAYQTS